MDKKDILEAVKTARKGARERKFKQSFDIAVSFRGLDLKNPSHKIKADVLLPNGRGKPVKIGGMAEGELAEALKKKGIEPVLDKAQLEKLGGNKKAAKKLVNQVDFFVSQPDLMVTVGKILGQYLGPRNKMPMPIPPKGDPTPIIARFDKLVVARIRDQPVIHCIVGTQEMKDEEITGNIEAVFNSIKGKLPRGEANIRAMHVKLTMGPSVKIGAIKKADEEKE